MSLIGFLCSNISSANLPAETFSSVFCGSLIYIDHCHSYSPKKFDSCSGHRVYRSMRSPAHFAMSFWAKQPSHWLTFILRQLPWMSIGRPIQTRSLLASFKDLLMMASKIKSRTVNSAEKEKWHLNSDTSHNPEMRYENRLCATRRFHGTQHVCNWQLPSWTLSETLWANGQVVWFSTLRLECQNGPRHISTTACLTADGTLLPIESLPTKSHKSFNKLLFGRILCFDASKNCASQCFLSLMISANKCLSVVFWRPPFLRCVRRPGSIRRVTLGLDYKAQSLSISPLFRLLRCFVPNSCGWSLVVPSPKI